MTSIQGDFSHVIGLLVEAASYKHAGVTYKGKVIAVSCAYADSPIIWVKKDDNEIVPAHLDGAKVLEISAK